jgi:DNA repair protein RecO (recombination protein O)
MDWTDTGIVLARRRHGESGAIVALFTRLRGRHLGRVRSLAGRRAGGVYEIGNEVRAHWRARLDEHLGNYDGELAVAHAARVLDDADRLAALSAAMTVIDQATPEREPHPVLYDATLELLAELARDDWPQRYVRWECACLAELGFGLSLGECAVTGVAEGLTHVSPRTGRAVSAAAAQPFADRLLTLPAFITDPALAATRAELLDGLALTGHFIERHVLAPLGHRMPAARNRLVDRIRRSATMPGSSQGI